ncbi:MAG: thioredoxin family protein [Pyrinomonadaceae bacterium]
MTKKKILLIIGGVVALLGLLLALFVGGVVWVAFSTIGNSEAARTAKTYLRQNEKLKGDIGEVRDFGFWVGGSINVQNADGDAAINLKVVSEKKTVPATVNLAYKDGRNWMVVGASYKNDVGRTVSLLDAYGPEIGSKAAQSGDEKADADNSSGRDGGFDEKSFSANVLQAERLVLVVFLSKYSLDSRELERTLDDLSETYSARVSLVRYNVDEQTALYSRFNIEKLPTLILFRNGGERERLTGAIKKQQLARLLDQYLGQE